MKEDIQSMLVSDKVKSIVLKASSIKIAEDPGGI